MSPQRILIVRLSAIGDVVHVLPALAALRRAFPEARIAWIAESLSARLLEGHPLIDELIVYPRRQWRKRGYLRALPTDARRFFGEMRRRRFDLAIDFQGLTKSAIVPWLSRVPRRIGYGDEDGREISRWFYTDRCSPPTELEHVVHRNLALLRPLGIETTKTEFPFPDLSPERERVGAKLRELGVDPAAPIALLNPGAGWESKRWPPERYGRLAGLLATERGMEVLIAWGPGEEALVDELLAAVDGDAKPRVHRAPPTDLRELTALIDHCALTIGGDTGPVHLAAARRVPVVCIYGGSDPARNRPIGDTAVHVLIDEECDCVPCWRVDCANPPPKCMLAITPEAVLEKVDEAPQQVK